MEMEETTEEKKKRRKKEKERKIKDKTWRRKNRRPKKEKGAKKKQKNDKEIKRKKKKTRYQKKRKKREEKRKKRNPCCKTSDSLSLPRPHPPNWVRWIHRRRHHHRRWHRTSWPEVWWLRRLPLCHTSHPRNRHSAASSNRRNQHPLKTTKINVVVVVVSKTLQIRFRWLSIGRVHTSR